MKRYIPLFPMLLVAVIGTAQTVGDTINRMVLVESTYNPIIAGAVKRNFIPEEVKPSMNKEKVVYADENVPLTTFDRMAHPAKTVSITSEKSAPGYARLGCGNYNNLGGLAAYKWRFGTSDDLTLKGHIDGWNGQLKPLNSTAQWRSHLCDMGVNADYSTQLRGVALETGIHAAYSSYNYLTDGTHNKGADLQQTGNLGVYIGVGGSIKSDFHYRARAGYAHSGRYTLLDARTPHSEGHFSIDGSMGMELPEWGMASVQLQGDVLTYRGIGYYHGYHSLSLTPRWDYRSGDFRFTTGFNMDFLGGNQALHTTPLQLSPECYVNYVPTDKPFTVRFTLDGGRDINTFGRLYALSPYWASTTQVLPTYTFMNARLEGGVRIVEGLHLHLGGGYKILSDALFETVGYLSGVTYTCVTNHNARVATLDVAFDYVYKDVANLSVKGTNHHWKLKGDRSLLARAPQFKVDADARVRIMPQLYAYTDLLIVSFTKVATRERAIIDWGLGANYAFSKRLSLFLDAHNLLGRRYSYYTGYPAQGFNVMMGAMFKF